jgi:hypothetical protein
MRQIMTKEQCIEWAVMCASDVLPIYEAAFPGDRRAIKAAQLYLLDPCEVTSKMAGEAARAARAATSAARAASSAAYAASNAAADAAADAAHAASNAASAAPDRKAAYIEMGREIIVVDR